MVYKVIGLMSGSSLDGLDIVYTELLEEKGRWTFEILASACYEYNEEWKEGLKHAPGLSAVDYQLLHTAYGHYLGEQVNRFIEENNLQYKVALISSHGHTVFHFPSQKMTAQLGDGASIAAETGLPVVTDLRALDVALGGQGAPIVPIGEKLLFPEATMFLNLGGIANISFAYPDSYVAYDVCPANRVLNSLAAKVGKAYDAGGEMAATGNVHEGLLARLNELDYYKKPYPKSLDNRFGTDEVYPLVRSFGLTHTDSLRTYVEHIVFQVKEAIEKATPGRLAGKLYVTGGGAFNTFLIEKLGAAVSSFDIQLHVPGEQIVAYKEALVMALMGVLRWRQESNVLSSVTGSKRDSIGGAVWIGQEA
ncbi:MAG TPA: anhydro-N-acetylmuramic acid kinase [Chitinophagaceae bacterium]|jgi:anhydro-N-acetylmuramic acid kinase|nr:anhydro-N-acetylmuramic acid kinase [Chitinophagaceae bacterium]